MPGHRVSSVSPDCQPFAPARLVLFCSKLCHARSRWRFGEGSHLVAQWPPSYSPGR